MTLFLASEACSMNRLALLSVRPSVIFTFFHISQMLKLCLFSTLQKLKVFEFNKSNKEHFVKERTRFRPSPTYIYHGACFGLLPELGGCTHFRRIFERILCVSYVPSYIQADPLFVRVSSQVLYLMSYISRRYKLASFI